MSKLKLVQERINENEEYEQNLRGLGITNLFVNDYPWVFLTVNFGPHFKKEQIENICNTILKVFQINSKQSKDYPHIFHFFSKNKILDHKCKAIELFGIAVFIQHQLPGLPMLMGLRSILHDRILATPSVNIHEETTSDFKDWDTKESGLKINEDICIYLSHANIHLNKNKLESNEIMNNFKKLSHDIANKKTQNNSKIS